LHGSRSHFSPQDLARTLVATSVCFDFSTFEILQPLTCGGTLVLIENPLALAVEAPDVTELSVVPSVAAELLRMSAVPLSVRVFTLGGEPLDDELVREVYRRLPHVEIVHNVYGPTEVTTYATLDSMTREWTGPTTIGRPIANTCIHVIDRHHEPT